MNISNKYQLTDWARAVSPISRNVGRLQRSMMGLAPPSIGAAGFSAQSRCDSPWQAPSASADPGLGPGDWGEGHGPCWVDAVLGGLQAQGGGCACARPQPGPASTRLNSSMQAVLLEGETSLLLTRENQFSKRVIAAVHHTWSYWSAESLAWEVNEIGLRYCYISDK